ncbi:MAG: hypothetical protein WDO56_07815 [Gammaproteobacteria bacterium]
MACSQCATEKEHAVAASNLERMRYFPRQLLTADDMRTEQEYFREKQRRHNRFLHGWGVVCGLQVVADPQAGVSAVQVCPGYALGPFGDEIYVAEPVRFDLAQCMAASANRCVPGAVTDPPAVGETRDLIVGIRYAECPSRPMRTLPAGCGCDESACEYSRTRDGFEIRCVSAPVVTKQAEPASGQPVPCPACSDDPWIRLATVRTGGAALVITYANRRVLPSPAMMPA